MFQIPNWGDDVPKTHIKFGKTNNKKKKNQGVIQSDVQSRNQKDNQHNKSALSNPFVAHRGDVQSKTKKKKRKPKPKPSDSNSSSSEFKPGQFVLNPNKRKYENSSVSNDIVQSGEIKNKRKKKSNEVLANTSGSNDISETNKVTSKSVISPMGFKINSKKEKIKKMLAQSNRNSIDGSSNSNNLRQRMLDKLKAAQFRYLNEKLYTSSGSEAKQLFENDPDAFQTYHQGYQQQVNKWPVNPLDLIVKRIIKMPKTHLIADLGCGEAALSKRVPHKVRSFDLVAINPTVEVCDMAHTPLLRESMDAAVYCLALMGTDLAQYLVEANRFLKTGGVLLIAEVEGRFDKVDKFTDMVQRLGFKLKHLDSSHKVFFFMEFVKVTHAPSKKSKTPAITLKPCLYKKR